MGGKRPLKPDETNLQLLHNLTIILLLYFPKKYFIDVIVPIYGILYNNLICVYNMQLSEQGN